VEDNLPRAEAAKLAGLTDDAVRKAMRDNAAARSFYASEVKALMNFAKAKAARADQGARRLKCCRPCCGRPDDPGGKPAILGRRHQHAANSGLRDLDR
jgi:hypothetical protein